MWCRLLGVVFAFSFVASAQNLSVKNLMAFIESSVKLKQSDKEVASFLSKVKLTERLDDKTIEEMQSLGIGPKTVAALRELGEKSQNLSVAAPVAPEPKAAPRPPPSSEEQAAILDEVRTYALNYSQTLPDYICTQVVRRYAAPAKGGKYSKYASRSSDPSWQLENTLTIRLSYFEQKENYKLILVNNMVTQQDYQKVGGTISTGEFGSLLRQVFERATETHFEWDHWALMRNRPSYVFSYEVSQERSQWHAEVPDQGLDIITAYRGLVYVDTETRQVLRITLEAVDLPPGFPIQHITDQLDYDYQELGDAGQKFLLPLAGIVRLDSADVLTKNQIEFRLYHKYTSSSDIKFDTDTPPPLPEDQTKEQAPK
jgi:hypothetical protein